jgi:hypothetical protein
MLAHKINSHRIKIERINMWEQKMIKCWHTCWSQIIFLKKKWKCHFKTQSSVKYAYDNLFDQTARQKKIFFGGIKFMNWKNCFLFIFLFLNWEMFLCEVFCILIQDYKAIISKNVYNKHESQYMKMIAAVLVMEFLLFYIKTMR